MFERMQIKEHMEVSDCNGQHVGTVDKIDDDDIVLTKSDSMDNQHHRIPMSQVDRVDDNRVYLEPSARIPEGIGPVGR
ncbi:DUF2171 domain-containing protein [Sphingomicrobium sediminis]|uniref:DUF2171 domain-containing protein n=1 Tax=Sphingomicrobium sediminis TaxID=2950949 RepID=A0A9X2J2G0_9SPHN|nr:DUF2171 domain-containing protein [Sphingomicrobium sediminis]MCM8557769.1 DUF2171 domain-containing protein [Sphingomicrobium sediminis]